MPRPLPKPMDSPAPQDDLTAAVVDAVQALPTLHKAKFLLDTSLALIDTGRYDDVVENYLDVYLRTPGLPTEDTTKAMLARGRARRAAGDRLLAKAKQDFQAVAKLDPLNRVAQSHLRRDPLIHFSDEPAHHRAPPEIWERVARHIPRHHLRTWLFVSSFHREIAQRLIFHTMDLYFGDDQADNVHKGLDVWDRVKADQVFAKKVKTLRIHWAYEEGDMLDFMMRLFRGALPSFTDLQEFEWIGYPELRDENVQAVLDSHPNLQSLGLIGWHFDAEGVSAFHNLRKFTLRAEDDDGWADMGEVRTVLDNNARTLRHLTLGAYLSRDHSWDSAFQSVTIKNLTHLDLVDTRISHIVLARIAHAHNLQSLTLHGTFEEPSSASVVFGSDHIIDGRHTFLPHLEVFRFVMVGHDDDIALFTSVVQFLRHRTKLRRLDLGSCPWELVQSVLPDLWSLRVLRVRIANLNEDSAVALVNAIPRSMVAIHLATVASDKPVDEYAHLFSRFTALSMLHLHSARRRRPQPTSMSEKDFTLQTDLWHASARHIATCVPSLDFVGWHGEHYVVVRGDGGGVRGDGWDKGAGVVELKELPTRRRLDCGTGVDLGSDDAAWLERKDVPIDYEMPGLEN
ncbi:hypothetical protein BD410DRAFT_782927 [Rickenella mellea]|uniref:F-box domain-containing protein n=1 Tax=Rickenella mellea TaxID=50990 RepID=A0A4Y7QGR1_9AGAM|nr:hypothetical protein BD410DRAFT_782927 [Rickenella mellea]